MALPTAVVRDANNAAQSVASLADLASNIMPMHSLDSSQQVYRASANFTPTATAGVVLFSIQGSATKTVRIRRITIGGVSTALSASVIALQKVSALGAGGTIVSPTIAKLDSGSAAATAVVSHYTSTLKATGTPMGGPLSTQLITTSTVTTPTVALAGVPQVLFPEGGAPIGQAIVLRGAAEYLEVMNVTPTNLAAGTVLNYVVEWIEDGS
jgi:hypothetical protein